MMARSSVAAPVGADPGLASPYVEATIEVPKDTPIPETGFAKLAGILAGIIRVEQPVHGDAVLERARILWAREKLEPADRAFLQQALRLAVQLQGVVEQGGFWRTDDAGEVAPRDRRACAPHLKRPAMVAPSEIEAACRELLGVVAIATEDELAVGAMKLLGLDAGSTAAVAARIAALVGAGRITLRG